MNRIAQKRFAILLALLMAIACLLGASATAFGATAKPKPFSDKDVAALDAKNSLLIDYVQLLDPSYYSWYYEEASGNTTLTMEALKGKKLVGDVTMRVDLGDDLINGLESDDKAPSLSKMTDYKPVTLLGASWFSSSFKLPTIRGIKIGATKKQVLAAFPNSGKSALYGITALNPKAKQSWLRSDVFIGGRIFTPKVKSSMKEDYVIEYGWTHLNKADEWREYYTLCYGMKKDKVIFIQLSYNTDAE